ncbi:ABC transporter permease [Microbacterium sp. NPDC012755]|uniref:ABC transporter permease n=1 Tax=Microbacterium sp. NPDC012755 TaxID=3364184 RepID=UPI0036BAFDC6
MKRRSGERMPRLSALDSIRTALIGPRSRKMRTALSALGVAVGIAALTAITGIAASNQAALLAKLDALGADMLVVQPGYGPDDKPVPLPQSAAGMIDRVDGVEEVGVLQSVPDGVGVYRNDLIAKSQGNGLTAYAASPDFLSSVEGSVAEGEWFDESTRSLPVTVLGAAAAARMGITEPGVRVWIGEQWYTVIGILDSAGLAESIDASAFLGDRWAAEHVSADGEKNTIASIYVRMADGGTGADVRDAVARAANPASDYVQVMGLGDLAGARETADDSLSGLAVGLAAIALLVGGIGIANTMVVTVLERRGEIGLRRALGARSGQIAGQFVGEALVLGGLGGLVGMLLGGVGVFVYAAIQGQAASIPLVVLVGGPLVALAVGVVAGLYPAVSAARLSPTTALRTV